MFQLVADVMEAITNMGDVLGDLWPLDNTPRVLMRVLIQYKFGANVADSEPDRCKIIAEFCDGVLRENASRAVGRLPPLSFRQAKERWTDAVERFVPAGRAVRDGGKGQQGFGGGGGGGAGGKQPGGNAARSRGAKFMFNGKLVGVCFDFNRGACNRKAAACGCEDRKGIVYAHVCNFFVTNANKYCLAGHPRVGSH
jgi:hypothetical protein